MPSIGEKKEEEEEKEVEEEDESGKRGSGKDLSSDGSNFVDE